MDNAPILTPDPGPTASGLTSHELDAVRARRASLSRAASTLKEVLRTPQETGVPVRAGILLGAVVGLADVWATHSEQTGGPDGVLAQVLTDCPRLAPAIARLRREHVEVSVALATARRQLEALPADAGTDPATDVPALTAALTAVERHRRDGRTLLHDAYQVDLGLGE